MMYGVVNLSCEATISLVVSNTNRQTQLIMDLGLLGSNYQTWWVGLRSDAANP